MSNDNFKAVGVHVFAGGFTAGVQKVFDVEHQLEVHGFGLETAERMCGIKCINSAAKDWPHVDAQFAYGNPRCTGFSTITSGYSSDTHGAWAKQTCDVHEFANYTAGRYDIAIWESVQQAYSTGKELLDYLRDEIYVPKKYRVAHVFINAATFGNSQQRRRYFFVAYRNDRNFNITPPRLDGFYYTPYHIIYEDRDRPTREFHNEEYDGDCYVRLTEDEKKTVEYLPNGWCFNVMGRYFLEGMSSTHQMLWRTRASPIPYSLHCPTRLNWLTRCPTLHSGCCRYIHPNHHRPITVREAAKLMGWPDVPIGKHPFAQIAKGVVPDVGTWLAEQARAYLNNEWAKEDWESSYNDRTAIWEGRQCNGDIEKVFDLTRYVGHELGSYNLEQIQQHTLHDVKRRWESDHGELLPQPRWWHK